MRASKEEPRRGESLATSPDAATEYAMKHTVTVNSSTAWVELPEVLSPEQVADKMGCCPKTVRDMCARGTIPAFKGGARWFISRDALRSLIEGSVAHE